MELFKIIQQMTPIEAFLVAIIVFYLGSKGILKIPFITNLLDKQKEKKAVKKGGKAPVSKKSLPADIILIIRNAIEKAIKIEHIRINETISEQMNEADILFEDTRKLMRKSFLTLFKQHRKGDINGLIDDPEVKFYLTIVESSETEMKGNLRRIMKKNHFLEKDENGFRTWIKEKTVKLRDIMTDVFDMKYSTKDFTISREELYEKHMKEVMPQVEDLLEGFFYRIREIAREKNDLIRHLEEDIAEFKG